jgi:hypothetical protein
MLSIVALYVLADSVCNLCRQLVESSHCVSDTDTDDCKDNSGTRALVAHGRLCIASIQNQL